MKLLSFIFTLFVLGSLVFAPLLDSQMATAETIAPKIIKLNALSELQSLEIENKKDQKRITKAENQLEKSLKDKFWEDDSSLTFLGKKVFTHEKKAIKELSKVKSVDVSHVASSLVNADMILAQLAIDQIPSDSNDKKIIKKLNKALKEMNKAQQDFDKNKLDKAVDHYKKAWKIAFMGEGVDVIEIDSASLDYSNDGVTDYYVQLEYTGDAKKPTIIGYKIQDECVDLGPKDPSDVGGDTFDDAAMKMGVSTITKSEWLIDDMVVWNDWFKKKNNDDNKMVDLVYSPVRKLPYLEELGGDNVIQEGKKKSSFDHSASISKLGGQSGWEGFMYFNAPPGEYLLWTVHPSGGIDECDRLTALGIPITIP